MTSEFTSHNDPFSATAGTKASRLIRILAVAAVVAVGVLASVFAADDASAMQPPMLEIPAFDFGFGPGDTSSSVTPDLGLPSLGMGTVDHCGRPIDPADPFANIAMPCPMPAPASPLGF